VTDLPSSLSDYDYPPVFAESRMLTDAELLASREKALAHWDRKTDLWLFGYGSLI